MAPPGVLNSEGAEAENALAAARRAFDEETTAMELVLLRMQERNQELCSDTAALREQVGVLQQALAEHEHLFRVLRFVLRLREDALHAASTATTADTELTRLREENAALQGLACDYAAFSRLRVQVYLLREAEARRAQAPSTFQEWENRVQELSSLVADLEKKCRDLLRRVHHGDDSDEMQLIKEEEEEEVEKGDGSKEGVAVKQETAHNGAESDESDDRMDLESPVKKPRREEGDTKAPTTDALKAEVERLREENARLVREAEEARQRAEQAESDFVGMGEALERSEKENARLRQSAATASASAATSGAGAAQEQAALEKLRGEKERIERQHSKLVQTLEDVEKRRAGERAEALKVIAQKARELSERDETIAELRRTQERLLAQLAAVHGDEGSKSTEKPGQSTQEVLQAIEAMSDSDDDAL